MKTLDTALQAHLDEGTTTLAWCWRIARADGTSFGFTDHDRTLAFDGTDFEPESGLTASEVRSGSDLSVDAQDAEGVLKRLGSLGSRRGQDLDDAPLTRGKGGVMVA